MTFRHSPTFVGAAVFAIFATGCATKKHVRGVVAPVEARVSASEADGRKQDAQIGELKNGLSVADEKAMEADKKARAAGESADRANQSADRANQGALSAGTRADEARTLAEGTRGRLSEVVENFDNYKQQGTETVLFNVGKSNLTKQAMQQLDQAIESLRSAKNYVLEVQGYTDKTGSAEANLALSERRADAVVRYLTAQHNVPLRKIHVLGVGAEGQTKVGNREARKQARKVEIKVYALDLNAPAGAPPAASNVPSTPARTTATTP